MFKPEHELVRQGLRELGKEIKALKPTAIVTTCGEFQSDDDSIQGQHRTLYIPLRQGTKAKNYSTTTVNLKEPTDIWFDIGPSWRINFPHVYDYKYRHKSSRALGEKVLQHLQANGIKAEGVERDLDHGM
jgi:4,5-DOPA dioxygenase extradiol